MTRVLLDEGVPRLLADALRRQGVDATAFHNEWKQFSDSKVIAEAESCGYDVLLTCDKNMPFQRPLRNSTLRVLLLPRSKLHEVLNEAEAIVRRLPTLQAGRYAILGRSGSLPETPTKPLEGT